VLQFVVDYLRETASISSCFVDYLHGHTQSQCLEEGLEIVLLFVIVRAVDSLCVSNMREDQESFGNQIFNVILLSEAGAGILSTISSEEQRKMYSLHRLFYSR
jgi:hypothetical protein